MYPPHLIHQQVKLFLDTKLKLSDNIISSNNKNISGNNMNFYKLPYIGAFSVATKNKILKFCKRYCKDIEIRIIFSPFKIGDLFSVKDSLPKSLQSFFVYKFTFAGCQSCYIGESRCHLSTRIKEHQVSQKFSHI